MKGHIRERGKGTWALIVDLGRDSAGKRKQKWHSFKGNKRDAQNELARLITELNSGTYVEPSKLSLAGYLDQWLDVVKPKLAARTHHRYCELMRLHVSKRIGATKLPKLRPLHIEKLYAGLRTEHDGKDGLSPTTILQVHRVLRNALKQAVRWNMLARNPCDMVDPPSAAKHEMRALEAVEVGQLLDAARGGPMHTPVLIAISTGLRRGELLAIKWGDIDDDKLRVQRALEQVGKVVTFKPPKTKRSERTMTLPVAAREALSRHRAQQAAHRLILGEGYKDQDLVFASVDGSPWAPDSFSGYWRRLIKRSKVPHVRLHDLRHTHASQLLKADVHVKVVSERLGHATIALTLDTYSHLLEGMEATAAAAMDEALGSVLI